MSTLFIVFSACLPLSMEPKCYDKELQLSVEEQEVTPARCMQIGQLELSKWAREQYKQTGKNWQIAKFRCESELRHSKTKKIET